MLSLLVAALLSQTIYEWTDAQGTTHFTDDRSTIPANAKKVRTTTGEDVMVLKHTEAPAVQQQPAATPTENACERLRKKVAALEAQRDQLFKDYEARVSEAQAQCRSQLTLRGQGAYARCTASVAERAGPPPNEQTMKLEIDGAKEDLRRAQVGGCG